MDLSFLRLLLALLTVVSATSRANAQATESAAKPADEQQMAPIIELDLPLVEGDVRVTGRTTVTSKSVIVRVYSGWSRVYGNEAQEDAIRRRAVTPTAERSQAVDAAQVEAQVRGKRITRAQEIRTRGLLDVAQALECLNGDPVITTKPVKVDEANGFEVLLKQRLNAGDCVVVEDGDIKKPSGEREAITSTIVRSVVLDLGRLRGYFSIGGTVSQGRNNFSQTDTFVGFTTDSRIVGDLVVKEICAGQDRSNCEPVSGPLVLRDTRWQLNAFADGRVGFRLATTGTEAVTTSASGGQPAQPVFQRPDQLVFGWDQPGYFQVGLHVPLSVKSMDWRNDGRLYSFFLSPLYKWGVQAFDAAVVESRTVEIDLSKPETDTARFKTTSETLRRGALPFYAYGLRVGIYQYELLGKELRNRQIANDPVGYFDVAVGKWAAYRSYDFERTRNESNDRNGRDHE